MERAAALVGGLLLLAAAASATAAGVEQTLLTARAWQRRVSNEVFRFPEDDLPELKSKSSSAIAFTGGGTRAMTAAFGQLAALHQLGLLQKIKYISGISGGSWATHAFSFYQRGAPGVARDDSEFLCGNVSLPSALTLQALGRMNSTCARGLATFGSSSPRRRGKRVRGEAASVLMHELWAQLFQPLGIPEHARFSWNKATAQDICDRNPGSFEVRDFLLPSDPAKHPFPVVGFTLLGPFAQVPFSQRSRSQQYTMIDVTPLYAGQVHTAERTFIPIGGTGHEVKHFVGGLIETFAFGSATAPECRLSSASQTGLLQVPGPVVPFSLANATLASSFAEGATLSLVPGLTGLLGFVAPYWSPASPANGTPAEPYAIADGGDFENVHLIGMLQRRVRSIVLFINAEQPMHGRAQWNPMSRPPTSNDFNDDIPWFFGVRVRPADISEQLEQEFSFDYSANQVFASDRFVPLALALQDKQAAGEPVVVTTELETVENLHWGIEAGFRVNVTWVYLSRLGQWEAQLPTAVRHLVVPSTGAGDFGNTTTDGPFAGFPNYSTDDLFYSKEKANILAELTGWGVLAAADVFRAALG